MTCQIINDAYLLHTFADIPVNERPFWIEKIEFMICRFVNIFYYRFKQNKITEAAPRRRNGGCAEKIEFTSWD